MIRSSSLIALALMAVACQPQKTPEQIAAEQQAAAMKQFTEGMAKAFGQTGPDGTQLSPEAMAAAIAQAGAIASSVPSDMTAEERAKMQAITGAMASGKVHPAASAWLAGANKAFAVLGKVTDVNSANAAKVQLAPIYAEMAGPAATLDAMNEDERDVAMGAAMPQVMSMAMNAMSLMMPLSSKPEVSKLVEDMLDDMPDFD
ncbi:MAG: hypothetical protein Q8R82_15800 [Hyphomonadaceae bacterium]|nr:hypothetical protein [Hyphomonadaceae bacterium]